MMKVFILFCVSLAVVWSVVSGKSHRISLKQRASGERTFVDSDGREVFFHGVNAIVKGPPWIPSTDVWDGETSLTDKDFDDLQSLGLNVIRLGAMWPGVQPSQDAFSEAYIKKLKYLVDAAAKRGIYTLLDMHQDVLSENFCGEGVPDWVIDLSAVDKTFPAPKNDNTTYSAVASDGFPVRADCAKSNWPDYYGTYETGEAFEALYDTTKSPIAAWSAFWARLASEFKDNEFVLGYELINEPWAGDVFAHPQLLIPGVADKNRLQPAYDVLSAAIRAVDPTTLLFFAAVTWDDPIPAGFTAAPGGVDQAPQSVFAYHYYSPPQMVPATYFHQRMADAARLTTGAMLTEFERPRNDQDPQDPYFDTVAAADKHLQSWAMWELKTFCKESEASLAGDSQNAAFGSCKTGYGEQNYLWDAQGVLNTNTTTKLSRTYPLSVAGTTSRIHFDPATASFLLEFALDTTLSQPTVVYANFALQYPTGYKITAVPERAVRVNTARSNVNLVEVWAREGAEAGTKVVLSIKRA